MRRTTVTARAESLATLEAEARRRGVPLATIFAEAVDDKAASIRTSRRPRTGLGRSTDGRSAAEVTADAIAHPPS
jgi:hypothetical protein